MKIHVDGKTDRVRRRPQTVNRRSRIFCSGTLAQGSVLLGTAVVCSKNQVSSGNGPCVSGLLKSPKRLSRVGSTCAAPTGRQGVKFDLIRRGGRTGLRSL